MKKFKLTFTLLSLVAATVFFSSCKDDDPKVAALEMKIGDQTRTLKSGVMEVSSSPITDDDGGDVYSQSLLLYSEGILVENAEYSGTGSALSFDLYSPISTGLKEGIYTLDWVTVKPFISDDANGFLDYNIDTEMGRYFMGLTGTLTVTKSGDIYTIDYIGTTVEDAGGATPKNVTAHFVGPIPITHE